MNKQRKVLITITYNEMGIIIDTKAEEVAQPVVKDINVPCTDTISRQAAIEAVENLPDCPNGFSDTYDKAYIIDVLEDLPSVQPEIIRCRECKHNPKYEWFGCPMSHLSEAQRPETAWCWKAERRTE